MCLLDEIKLRVFGERVTENEAVNVEVDDSPAKLLD